MILNVISQLGKYGDILVNFFTLFTWGVLSKGFVGLMSVTGGVWRLFFHCPVDRFDVTELQICLVLLQTFTTAVGPTFWNTTVNPTPNGHLTRAIHQSAAWNTNEPHAFGRLSPIQIRSVQISSEVEWLHFLW